MHWWPKDPVDEASDKKLPLELDSLETLFQTIDQLKLTTATSNTFFEEVSKLFANRKNLTWEDRYRIESKIGYLLGGDRLRQEISNRLRWAKADRVPEAEDLQTVYATLLKSPDQTNDEVLRDFLLEVTDATHAHRRRKYIIAKLQAKATFRILFLVLVVLVVIFLFLTSLTLSVKTDVSPANFASLQDVVFGQITIFQNWSFWQHFGLYASALFGLLGALFSRLIGTLQPRSIAVLDELYVAATLRYIFLRGVIGILGALVVYFFLQSGLVEGSVFPKFNELGMKLSSNADKWPTSLLLLSGSLALLIMWSFIAGFSESLVPTILSNVERQLGGAISSRQ